MWKVIALGASIVLLFVWLDGTDFMEEQRIENARKQKARETPHVIREADGCKVYRFESGARWHYFTRCPETTQTETTWNEYCGKGCNKEMSSTMTTKNGQAQ